MRHTLTTRPSTNTLTMPIEVASQSTSKSSEIFKINTHHNNAPSPLNTSRAIKKVSYDIAIIDNNNNNTNQQKRNIHHNHNDNNKKKNNMNNMKPAAIPVINISNLTSKSNPLTIERKKAIKSGTRWTVHFNERVDVYIVPNWDREGKWTKGGHDGRISRIRRKKRKYKDDPTRFKAGKLLWGIIIGIFIVVCFI